MFIIGVGIAIAVLKTANIQVRNEAFITMITATGIFACLLTLGAITKSPKGRRVLKTTMDSLVLTITIATLIFILFATEHQVGAPIVAMLTAIYLAKKLKKEPETYVDRYLADPLIFIGTFMTTAIFLNGEMLETYKGWEGTTATRFPLIVGLCTEAVLSIIVSHRVARAGWEFRKNNPERKWTKTIHWGSLLVTPIIFFAMVYQISEILDLLEDPLRMWWIEIWTEAWWIRTPILMVILQAPIGLIATNWRET